MTDAVWERFARLFAGYELAYGQYRVGKEKDDRGKRAGKALTVSGAPGELQWRNHLNGTHAGMGGIPLREDNTVLFAAIDIDIYNLNHADLEKAILHHKFPLTICKSKSGGAHCYIFFKEPADTAAVREKLAAWASALGFGGVEVFPKQSYRAAVTDVGNWINLPYFNAINTERPAFVNGRLLTVTEFLDHAEATQVDPATLGAIRAPSERLTGEDEEFLAGAPPCLCHFAATGGLPEGMRNEGMFNFGAYLKKRFPDAWQDKIAVYNQRYCAPPLTLAEVNALAKSIGRKGYDLKCSGPHCDRKKCRAAKFGIGGSATGGKRPEIGAITKYEGDPTYWAIEIEGLRVMCDTETLLSQNKFNLFCMEKINRVPGSLPKNRWEEYLDGLLANVDVIVVPEDASKVGQFAILLETFCTQTNRVARALDEVKLNKPYRHDGKIYFVSRALFEFLEEKRFRYENEHQVWQWLKEKFNAEKKYEKLKDGGANVWTIQDRWEVTNPPVTREPVPKEEF